MKKLEGTTLMLTFPGKKPELEIFECIHNEEHEEDGSKSVTLWNCKTLLIFDFFNDRLEKFTMADNYSNNWNCYVPFEAHFLVVDDGALKEENMNQFFKELPETKKSFHGLCDTVARFIEYRHDLENVWKSLKEEKSTLSLLRD